MPPLTFVVPVLLEDEDEAPDPQAASVMAATVVAITALLLRLIFFFVYLTILSFLHMRFWLPYLGGHFQVTTCSGSLTLRFQRAITLSFRF